MRERVEKVLYGINSEIVKYSGDSMIQDGVIDSFDIIEIVSELEDEFDIEIDAEYIIEENFRNIESIISMLEIII